MPLDAAAAAALPSASPAVAADPDARFQVARLADLLASKLASADARERGSAFLVAAAEGVAAGLSAGDLTSAGLTLGALKEEHEAEEDRQRELVASVWQARSPGIIPGIAPGQVRTGNVGSGAGDDEDGDAAGSAVDGGGVARSASSGSEAGSEAGNGAGNGAGSDDADARAVARARALGVVLRGLRESGFSLASFRQAGFAAYECRAAGFPPCDAPDPHVRERTSVFDVLLLCSGEHAVLSGACLSFPACAFPTARHATSMLRPHPATFRFLFGQHRIHVRPCADRTSAPSPLVPIKMGPRAMPWSGGREGDGARRGAALQRGTLRRPRPAHGLRKVPRPGAGGRARAQ